MSLSSDWLELHRDSAAQLVRVVSLATTVEPELLRAARLDLCPELGVEAESLVWFSPLVISRGPAGIAFSSEALQAVWTGLKGKKDLLERMRSVTGRYHQGLAPALQWEEEIVYYALLDKPESAAIIRTKLQDILKTMISPENSRLAVWAERALPRLPDAVRLDGTFSLVAQAVLERGGRGGVFANAGSAPSWLKPVRPETPIGVRLLGRAVEFSEPPAPGSVSANAPEANPMMLLISDKRDFAPSPGFPRQVALTRGRTVTEQIDLLPELYIRPAGGRTFVVSPVQYADSKPSVLLARESGENGALRDLLYSALSENFDVALEPPSPKEAAVTTRDVLVHFWGGDGEGAHWAHAVARDHCKRIIFALPPAAPDYGIDPGADTVDFRQREHWPAALNELRALLRTPYEKAGALFGVPPLPKKYLPTPDALEKARAPILSSTSGRWMLDGVPGSGRSTLAAALARDCQVRRHFRNGVYWLYNGGKAVIPATGSLVIFDYRVPEQRLLRDLGQNVILYTKEPGFDSSGLARIAIQLPPRRPVEVSEVSFDTMTALATFPPDTRIPESVYRRVFTEIPVDALNRLDDAGFIQLLPDASLVVREPSRDIL
jgi:hypothetical protein